MPPFSDRVPAPFQWAASLPGRIGQKVVIGIGEEGIGIGGGALRYQEVGHVTTRVSEPNPGVTATIVVESLGTAPSLQARLSTTGKHTDEILATVGYLWDLLSARVGPRARANVAQALETGAAVVVGGFSMAAGGIAMAKRPDGRVPWSHVGDPEVAGLRVHLPAGTGALSASIGEQDAYLLHDLVPELRARFA
jgi:hypothetical protein